MSDADDIQDALLATLPEEADARDILDALVGVLTICVATMSMRAVSPKQQEKAQTYFLKEINEMLVFRAAFYIERIKAENDASLINPPSTHQ